jgi:acetylornithine deacetylase/succinyl-diaminopimelate desuccinylase-like protein
VTIDAARVAELALELVEVESPTGDTAAAARLFAERLADRGLEVELVETFPSTPVVVGRLRGGRPGQTVVLNGHLDTVPIPHAPPRVADGVLHGRGAADMKGALAAAAEAVGALAASGEPFAGEAVVVATGLHEAPGGRGEDLAHLLGPGGFHADLAIVCELCGHDVAVAHMGQATAEIAVTRPGMPTHELQTPAGTPHPLVAAARVVAAVAERSAELAAVEHPWVGAETYFVGELHGGDFYNRHPSACRIVGTRRWAPGNTLAAVEGEYRALLDRVAAETGCTIELELKLVREAYSIDPDHPLVTALQASYREVTGRELERSGRKTVADAAIFAAAGVPTVYHGPVGSGAHADEESMPVAELVRAGEVYVRLLRRLLREEAA